MARTIRVEVTMEPREYERLEYVAQRRGVSVADLIGIAMRERYLLTRAERRRIPVIEWEEAERAVAEAHGGGLP